MDIPPGCTTSSLEGVMCKLQKVLNGLKQSPRAWFDRFNLAIMKYRFRKSNLDHTMFLKHK